MAIGDWDISLTLGQQDKCFELGEEDRDGGGGAFVFLPTPVGVNLKRLSCGTRTVGHTHWRMD